MPVWFFVQGSEGNRENVGRKLEDERDARLLEKAVRTSSGTGKMADLLAARRRLHKRRRLLAKAGRIDIKYVRPHDRGRR